MNNKRVRKKICFLIPSVSAGGIETYLLRFLKYFGADEHVTVIVRGQTDGKLRIKYEATGVRLLFKPLEYVNPRKMIHYYHFFKQESFDVVCDFNANFAGLPMLIARLVGVPRRVAFYRQGSDHFKPGIFRNIINRIMNRLVYYHSTTILSNSMSGFEFFFPDRNKNDQRFHVIYNGVNPEEFRINSTKTEIRNKLDLPADKFIIGHVGRLDNSKNHSVILETAEIATQRMNDVHFVLCGEDTEKLSNEIKKKGLEQHFTLLGYQDDIPELLHSFDLFFFPSVTEGQPNALIEAMFTDLPIMASDIPPIKECVPTNAYGQLSDPHDPQMFADILKEIRENNIYKDGYMARWAREKFNSEQNFKDFKNVLI